MVIYTLCDSGLPGVIRYVGQTANSLEERLRGHLKQAIKQQKKSHKCDWIRKVYSEGRTILISTIAYASTTAEIDELEIRYIRTFRSLGFDLTNHAPGGSTVRGLKWSDESRKRGSDAAKRRAPIRHTEKFKKDFGDRRRGIIVSQETRNRLSKALSGRPNTEKQKKKISDTWKKRVAERNGQPESVEVYEARIKGQAARAEREKDSDARSVNAHKGWETRRLKQSAVISEPKDIM